MSKRVPLTEQESAYLAELRRMQRAREHFTHRIMCLRFGWASVHASWDVMHRLEAKGYSIDVHRVVARVARAA